MLITSRVRVPAWCLTPLLLLAAFSGGSHLAPASAAPVQGATFTWLRSWAEAQQIARARGCLILVSSTRPGCTLCEAFRNQIVPQCAAELAPLAVGYVYNSDRPEDRRPDRVLRDNLARARLLPLVGFLTAEGAWVHGFWGPRKVAQFRGDLAHARSVAPVRPPSAAPLARPSNAPAQVPTSAPAPSRVGAVPAATAPAVAAPTRPTVPPASAAAPTPARVIPPAVAPATAAPPSPVVSPPVASPPAATPAPTVAPAPSSAPEETNLEELCPGGVCHLGPEGGAACQQPSGTLPDFFAFDPDRPMPRPAPATPTGKSARDGERAAALAARPAPSRAPQGTASSLATPLRPVVRLEGSPDGEEPKAPTLAPNPVASAPLRAVSVRPPSPTPAPVAASPAQVESDPVIVAARAGRWRDAFKAGAEWTGPRRLALERSADTWGVERMEMGLLLAQAGRHDQALAALEDVAYQLVGRAGALEAQVGRAAVEALRDMRRLRDPAGELAQGLRRVKREELGASRWARLFADDVR